MLSRERCFGRLGLANLTAAAVLLASSFAFAQEQANVSTSRPGASAFGNTDHDRFVGSFAVGYLGSRSIPIAANPVVNENNGFIQMEAEVSSVDAPVIGMRYWFNEDMGVDVGLGIRRTTGSATWTMHQRNPANPASEPVEFEFKTDALSQTGILLHGGLPIVFSKEKHYVFELVPETNIGFSTGTLKDQPIQQPVSPTPTVARDDIKISGLRFDLGARVGSEVHFGFIGVPNLSLQASVGLFLSMQKIKADGGSRPPSDPGNPSDAQPKTTYQVSSTEITTSVQDSPWGIFTNSISALYYF